MANAYIEVAARGFANETYFAYSTPKRIAAAVKFICASENAWARRIPESMPELRKYERLLDRIGETLPELTAKDLTRYCDEWNGSRAQEIPDEFAEDDLGDEVDAQ